MRHFTFADNYLRTYVDTITYSFKFITEPVNYKKLSISIMIGGQNINNLVKLIPKIEELAIHFSDSKTKYNIEPLNQLTNLKYLTITSQHEKESLPRLYGINTLGKSKLRSLVVYNQVLNLIDPIYPWPRIRNPIYHTINNITVTGCTINYNMKLIKFHKNLLENQIICCDNFIVQEIQSLNEFESRYQVIYRCYEQYSDDRIHIQVINKAKFLGLIFGTNILNLDITYPKCRNDLFMDDKD